MTEDGGLSSRGQNVMQHTPMKRLGEAEELLGCFNWLIDDRNSGFITGITVAEAEHTTTAGDHLRGALALEDSICNRASSVPREGDRKATGRPGNLGG